MALGVAMLCISFMVGVDLVCGCVDLGLGGWVGFGVL